MNVKIMLKNNHVATAYMADGPNWDGKGITEVIKTALERALLKGKKKFHFKATLGGGTRYNCSGPSWSHTVEEKPTTYVLRGRVEIHEPIEHWEARYVEIQLDADLAKELLNIVDIDVE